MALTALAMMVFGLSVARVRHARLWALSFALQACEWALIAVFYDTPTSPKWPMVLVSLAAIGGAFVYYAGFRARMGRGRLHLLLIAGLILAIVQILLVTSRSSILSQFLGYALFPGIRVVTFAAAIPLVARHRQLASATERSVIAILAVLSLVEGALVALCLLRGLGEVRNGVLDVVLAVTTTPSAAAIGLFTLMLIASDFSRERRRIIHTDPLTGVLNRGGFEQAAHRLIARARPPANPLSLVLADIDRFKMVNDEFGHLTGDAALIGFARQITDGLPDAALVGRFGGEEFALLLPAHDGNATHEQIEAIRNGLPEMAIPGGLRLGLTASFGIAEQLPRETLAGLYARADAALYLAKQAGRNRSALDGARPG